MCSLQVHNGLLRNKKGALLSIGGSPYPAVLAGAQDAVGIRKHCRQANGAGPDIDRAVRQIKLAFQWISDAVPEHQLEFEPLVVGRDSLRCREAAPVPQVRLLAGSEVHLDGVDRGDRGYGSAPRSHQGPDLLLGGAWDTVNRGAETCETQIDPSRID